MDLNWLCKESYRIAHEKGWHDRPRTFSTAIANFHGELSEAWFLYARGRTYHDIFYSGEKPEGIPIELADFLIRVGDCVEEYDLKLKEMAHEEWNEEYTELLTSFPDFLSLIHLHISRAYEQYKRTGLGYDGVVAINLSCAISSVLDWGKLHNVDLEAAVKEKMAYNSTRTYRHGNKVV